MLLRFFVHLAGVQVIEAVCVRALLNQMVDSAMTIARTADDASGRSWQPYTDFVVYSALISLPWGATVVFGADSEEWNAFSAKIDAYISQRPIQRDISTSPFLASLKENDVASQ